MPVDSTTSGSPAQTRETPGSDHFGRVGLGILIGGRSSRMGGQPKGLLHVPGSEESLVVHALRVGAQAGCEPRWLVGDVDAYDALVAGQVASLDPAAGGAAGPAFRGRLKDDPAGVGPLGGLRALLLAASASELPHVIAVACDMPRVTSALLTALREHPSEAAVLAARRGPEAPWEPLLARYRPSLLLPAVDAALAAGERSFQKLLARVTVTEFEAPGLAHALDDWDRPEDVR